MLSFYYIVWYTVRVKEMVVCIIYYDFDIIIGVVMRYKQCGKGVIRDWDWREDEFRFLVGMWGQGW